MRIWTLVICFLSIWVIKIHCEEKGGQKREHIFVEKFSIAVLGTELKQWSVNSWLIVVAICFLMKFVGGVILCYLLSFVYFKQFSVALRDALTKKSSWDFLLLWEKRRKKCVKKVKLVCLNAKCHWFLLTSKNAQCESCEWTFI